MLLSHSLNGRSSWLRPSPTKRSLRSKTCGFSESSRSATPNCAKPWSIRLQRPKCSASSAARLPTSSRSSTLSSRAPRGFVGSMTWCCDSRSMTIWFRGPILVPYPYTATIEMSVDEPHYCWVSEHGTLHVPDVRAAQNDFPMFGAGEASAPFWPLPFVSRSNSLER